MADDIEKLIKEARDKGYSPYVDKNGILRKGNVRSDHIDPELEGRIRANKAAISTYLMKGKTPNTINRANDAKSWLGATQAKIQSYNKAINKAVEGMPLGVGGISIPGSEGYNPLNALMPKSATGKALLAAPALVAGGVEAAGLTGLGAIGAEIAGNTAAGIGGAALSGESKLGGAIQGGLAGAAGQLPRIKTGAQAAYRKVFPTKLIHGGDLDLTNGVVSRILGLPGVGKAIAKGKNWVHVLRAGKAQDEAFNRMITDQDGVIAALGRIPDRIKTNFRSKWALNTPRPANWTPPEGMVKEAIQYKQQIGKIMKGIQDIKANVRELRSLGRAAYTNGTLKPGQGAWEAAEKMKALNQGITNKITSLDKQFGTSLAKTWVDARKSYAGFKALQQLADLKDALIHEKELNTEALQQELSIHPRRYERRLGDAYEVIRDALRGSAPPEAGIDVEGILSRAKAHVGSHGVGSMYAYLPAEALTSSPLAQFVGGRSVPPVPPPSILSRVIPAEAANRSIDMFNEEDQGATNP